MKKEKKKEEKKGEILVMEVDSTQNGFGGGGIGEICGQPGSDVSTISRRSRDLQVTHTPSLHA